jgi:peptide/nickel transport system substrate-binding protein
MKIFQMHVRVARFALAALVLPLVAACGSPASPTQGTGSAAPSSAAASSSAASSAPASSSAASSSAAAAGGGRGAGGTLRLLWWQAPTILNSHLATGTKDYDASRVILEPLAAATGEDGTLVPVLAAEIPTIENGGVAADSTSVTWKLKTDVTWSDGTPFTADDVVFTYQYCSTEETGCTNAESFSNVETIEALDPATVKVTWSRPNPNAYQMFVSYAGHILQKAQFQNCVGANAATDTACQQANNAPIGTGPYKLREFRSGDTVLYEINENYRDPNKPFFTEVQLKGGGDAPSAARAVFQTGDTDYAWNLQVEGPVLQQLQQGGKGEFITIPGSSVERIVINFTNPDPALGENRAEPDQPHPFLTDLNVRRALALAIDRAAVAGLYPPGANPTCELITTEPFIDPAQIYGGRNACEPDIEAANQLLDEAGWVRGGDGIRAKDGVPLRILFQTSTNTLRQKEQALVKAAWDQLGVATELKNVDAGVFFSSDAANPDTIGHFFADVQMYTNNYEQPDPTNYLCGFTTEEIASKANGYRLANNGRFSNEQYDELCAQLRTEVDPAKREELVLQMNDILVQEVAIIPLVARPHTASGRATGLQGINLTAWDSELWNIADWTMAP